MSLADQIWDFAEIRFREHQSSAAQMEALRHEGFQISRNLAGMPTAFVAEFGKGAPVIAILGEFDALAGLSQVAGMLEKKPIDPERQGHGCGHHLLGTAGIMAAVAVKGHLEATGGMGTIRYYGCPAEEGGSGKTYMARSGVFNDVDAALCWHPGTLTGVMAMDTLANIQAYFHFTGTASHAAVSPHLGRSALDAVELMNVGANYMREHMPQTARMHYAVTNTGGISPNVVQADASVLYLVRSPDMEDVKSLFARVQDIAKGAALMTQTTVRCQIDRATSPMLANNVLDQLLQTRLEGDWAPGFDPVDQDFADKIRETFSESEIAASFQLFELETDAGLAMHHGVVPLPTQRLLLSGSTDVSDVSQVVPTAQFYGACYAVGTQFHTWQMVTQGKLPAAHKGMTSAAVVLASSAIDLMQDAELLAAAKAEFKLRRGGRPYECPIPADISPPVEQAA
ncbi:M20 family metallopeptidase [Tianweitania sp.]|uniref:M20 family metallopeptidase n=1 Tax=Tianweitania sp. TaxID=2021634 RepID=UPI002897B279|nr:M20 family metallopeptidase [Tianweitania sp.]